ncbi:MAG: DUF3795 domain-containing protein [Candidatus Bipolaricaulota bacterium]|nr:DUF3795 domain-containing protein [Candidatus Bipolaricaulota bacterium]
MLGYCGINCEECTAYKGTVTTDMSLLEKSAGSFWNGAYSAQEWVCLGCTPADQPFIAKFCAKCKIRVCAIAKGLPNCAACSDYEVRAVVASRRAHRRGRKAAQRKRVLGAEADLVSRATSSESPRKPKV